MTRTTHTITLSTSRYHIFPVLIACASFSAALMMGIVMFQDLSTNHLHHHHIYYSVIAAALALVFILAIHAAPVPKGEFPDNFSHTFETPLPSGAVSRIIVSFFLSPEFKTQRVTERLVAISQEALLDELQEPLPTKNQIKRLLLNAVAPVTRDIPDFDIRVTGNPITKPPPPPPETTADERDRTVDPFRP